MHSSYHYTRMDSYVILILSYALVHMTMILIHSPTALHLLVVHECSLVHRALHGYARAYLVSECISLFTCAAVLAPRMQHSVLHIGVLAPLEESSISTAALPPNRQNLWYEAARVMAHWE